MLRVASRDTCQYPLPRCEVSRPEAIDRAEGKCRSASSGKHPNIRTSYLLALECSDVRLVGQETRKRVVELRCPVTVPREIGTLSRMNDDGDAYEKAQTSAWRGKDPDPASDALFN